MWPGVGSDVVVITPINGMYKLGDWLLPVMKWKDFFLKGKERMHNLFGDGGGIGWVPIGEILVGIGRMAAGEEPSAVGRACDEAQTALKLFLQGRFDEGERFLEERVDERAKDELLHDRLAVAVFTHCHAVIAFAKAGITGAEEDRKNAMQRLEQAAFLAAEHVPKQGWVQSLASWGMGYFTTPSAKVQHICQEELSCRIIGAESTYLCALLCFFGESMTAFIRGAFLFRRAIQGYKQCHALIQRQLSVKRSEHDVGAVKLGVGGFSLAMSLLPPRLLRLLSVLGFPCDRAAGLSEIELSLLGGGLRACIAGVLLLSYHVILPSFFSIPQERKQHVTEAERVLEFMVQKYPDSFFLSFYKGRLQRLKKDLSGSMSFFLDLEQRLKLPPDSKFFKLRHAWVYELGLGNMLQLKWEGAEQYWAELEEESVWSRAFFSYVHGVCLSMRGERELAASTFGKVEGLMRGTLSGRILAEEQYVARMVKCHRLDTVEGVNQLQGRICGVTFLYLWNSFPQMPKEELDKVVNVIEDAEGLVERPPPDNNDEIGDVAHNAEDEQTDDDDDDDEDEQIDDDAAVCNLVKGTALRELGRLLEAQTCLDFIREETCNVETELFVFPMAAYERALLLISLFTQRAANNPEEAANFDLLLQAKEELALAENFKEDYNFLWRLLGRAHAARLAIQALMGEESKKVVDSTMSHAVGEFREDESSETDGHVQEMLLFNETVEDAP